MFLTVLERNRTSWSLVTIGRRAKEVLTDEGVRSLWFKVLGEICYRRLLILEQVMEGSPGAGTSGLGRLSLLTPSDLDRYGRLCPDADLNKIRKRLERGDICFAMNHEGQMIHVCWVTRGPAWVDYLDCEILLPAGAGYAYEAFTKPQFRGRGVAGARTRLMEGPLMEAGYRSVISAIGPENRTALHFNMGAGHRVVGLIGYWRFARWRRYFCRVRGASFAALAVKPLRRRR